MSICNVNIGTGDVYHHSVDFYLRGFIPLRFIRDYDSGRTEETPVGHRWRHNQNYRLRLEKDRALYIASSGEEFEVPHPDAPASETKDSRLTVKREGVALLLSDSEGNALRFEPLGGRSSELCIKSRLDPRGNRIEYDYYRNGVLRSLRDTCGRIITFEMDHLGRMSSASVHHPEISHSDKELVRYGYDLAGNLRSVRDRNGGVNTFAYEGHLLVMHINPLGGRTYFKYDSKNRCIHTYREDRSHERKLEWDDKHHAVEVRDSRGAVWFYQLNDQGHPFKERDPLGRVKEYVYDGQGNLEFIKNENTAQSITLFFKEKGLLINQTGSMTSTVQFDDKMRVVEEVNAAGAKWSYKYDDHSNRVQITDPRQFLWHFEYDSDGWLSAATDPRGFRFTRTRKSILEVEYADVFGVDALLHFTSTGLLDATIDGLGRATRFEYRHMDLLAAIHYVDGAKVEFGYDAMENITRIQTESGAATVFDYDNYGAPISVTNANGHRGGYSYDSEGNLVQIRNFNGEIATISYDLLRNITATTLFDGRSHKYTNDTFGGVTSVRDQNNDLLLQIERDELGRIAKKIFPGGWEVLYKWGEHSQLLEATNPSAKLQLEWTADLRVAAESVNGFAITYEYDEVGNRKRLITDAGREIQYFWDARNRLTKIIDKERAEYRFTYSALNLFQEWICPSVVQEFAFDARQRMVGLRVRRPGAVLVDRSYEYDIQGRLARMRDLWRGAYIYRYSDIDAILEVRSESGAYAESYSYDPNENLTRMATGERISYTRGNRLQKAGNRSFEHNAAGSVTRITENGRSLILNHNPEGQISEVQLPNGRVIEYKYDPLGRRIIKKIGSQTTSFLWDQGSLLSESSAPGQEVDYLFLPGTLIPLGLSDGAGHYSFALDQAGTPAELIDAHGDFVWTGDYTAFGEPRGQSTARIRNPFRFQGQYQDEETGFHYHFFRYYYPPCARYLSQDPLGLMAGANVYRYVLNPFNWVDPFGLNNLVNGVLTVNPICGWKDKQQKEARKKMAAMNKTLGDKGGVKIPSEPVQRCGASAKDIYEDCQAKAKAEGKPPLADLKEGGGKCHNEQADHILEICAGGGEKDCNNLQPLNESVNKSYGSQVAAAVRANPGAVLKEVKLAPMTECTDRGYEC